MKYYAEIALKLALIISSISSTMASYYINNSIYNKIQEYENKVALLEFKLIEKAKVSKKLTSNIIQKIQPHEVDNLTNINPYYEPTFILKAVMCTVLAITVIVAAYYITSTTIEVCGVIKTTANDTKSSLDTIPERIKEGADEIIKSATNNAGDAIEEVYSSTAKTAIDAMDYMAGDIINV